MKVYKVQTTIVVEDRINNEQIEDVCRGISELISYLFLISSHYTIYHQDEIIDYADPPYNEDDIIFSPDVNMKIKEWEIKSKEIINNIKMKLKNP